MTGDVVYTAQWKLEDAVQNVISEIDRLPAGITLANQAAVEAAMMHYQALSAAQKNLVSNYPKLNEASLKIIDLIRLKKEAEEEDAMRRYSNPRANATYRIPLKKKQKTTALKVLGLAGVDRVLTWKSSDPKKVSVQGNADGTCQVRAGSKLGNASITATCRSGREVVFRIKVQKNKVKTKKIRTASKTLSMSVGETLPLEVEPYPVTSVEKVKYSSGNKKVVSVSGRGILKAKKKGKTVITVKSGSRKIKVKVTVN